MTILFLILQRCKEKLNTLAISVMNQWPGVRLRVTEAWDEEDHHARRSLHYEGRAVDVTTSDRDRRKYGLLASLAVHAGFDWVYYESRSHVHLSCKAGQSWSHYTAAHCGAADTPPPVTVGGHILQLINNSNVCLTISESAATDKHTGCFTAEAKVVREDGLRLNMSEVSLGDRLQSVDRLGNIVYSEVLMFMDREPEERMQFIVLTGEEGSVLTLTPSHLVYTGGAECGRLECMAASYAGNVASGDTILVTGGQAGAGLRVTRVASVSVTASTGVFAPLTRSGNLVVDGVLASCYAVIDSQSVAHTAFLPVRWYYSLKAGAASFLRSVHILSEAVPRSLSMIPSGVHWYPDLLYSLARLVMPSHLAL